jgi:hypothetical protein
MKRDIDLVELLVLWYRYESQWTPVEGYPRECPSTAGYMASRQYDDQNQAAETDARGQLAAHIGRIVAGIDEPWRSALAMVARNRSSGAAVWRSARLPEADDARAEVVAEAMELFAEQL